MPDLIVGLGLDNRQFKQSLDASLSQTQVAAQRIGMAFKANTKPIRELSQGIMSIGIVGGLVAGAVTGIADVITRIGERQRENTRALLAEVDARRKIRQEIELLSTKIGSFEREEQEIRNRTRDRLGELAAEARALGEELAKTNYGFGDVAGNTLIDALTDDGKLLAEKRKRLEEIVPLMKSLTAEEQNQLEIIRQRRAKEIKDSPIIDEIARLRSLGRIREAEEMEERRRTAEARQRKRQLAGDDERLFAQLIRGEINRHKERLQEIAREEEARKRAAEEQAKRERELAEMEAKRIRQTQEDAALSIEAQEVERLRLTNQTKAAEQLERQLEHRRRMLEIDRMEGISEEQRRRLRENEVRNAALRGSQSPAFTGEIRQAPIGILNQRLLDRVFGPETQEDEATRIAKETLALLKQWRDAQRILIW